MPNITFLPAKNCSLDPQIQRANGMSPADQGYYRMYPFLVYPTSHYPYTKHTLCATIRGSMVARYQIV